MYVKLARECDNSTLSLSIIWQRIKASDSMTHSPLLLKISSYDHSRKSLEINVTFVLITYFENINIIHTVRYLGFQRHINTQNLEANYNV